MARLLISPLLPSKCTFAPMLSFHFPGFFCITKTIPYGFNQGFENKKKGVMVNPQVPKGKNLGRASEHLLEDGVWLGANYVLPIHEK